ncbi:MAG: Sensory box histidine kinase/response regulator [Labilithrix sp.]|nr:Sensory box histidine kinase/response regulator [Labilithrix sp.]
MSRAGSIITSLALALALFVGTWAAPGVARAGEPVGRFPFRHYGSDDGLTTMNLYMGVQDGAGFTWAGGTAGLVRYDGLRFRRYGISDGLPSLLVTDLAVSPTGVLWGTTSRGAFRESGGELVAFGTRELPENATYQVAFDGEGRFCVTTSQGPYVRTGADTLEIISGWPGGEAFAILFERDGALLVGHGQRLLRRAPGARDFTDVGQDFGGTVTALVRDGTGRLWLRAGAKLWSQARGATAFVDRSDAYLGALPGPYPRRLGLDADGKLLIPSTIGLITVDDTGARFVPVELPADAMSLRDAWVDHEGALWLVGMGLHRQIGRGLWRSARTADGLPSNAVWGMLRASTGALVVATETGAARTVDGRLERLPGIEMAGYVSEGPPGTLWFAGDGRLIRHDLATNTSHALGAEAGLPPVAIVSTIVDRRGNLWVAFDSGGVYRAPLSTLLPVDGRPAGKLERVALPGGDPSEMITKMFVDGPRVWLATGHGLYVERGDGWQRLTTADGLRSDAPSLITRYGSEMCIAYVARTELSCFVYEDGRLTKLHHQPVPGQLVPELLGEDANGRMWIGTTQGLLVLEGGHVDQFTRGDGAPGDDVSFDTFFADRDGTVWIGSSAGLGRFDGAHYHGPPPAPSVTLVSSDLAGKPVDATNGASPEVPYLSSLNVRFSALSNIDERHIEHQVKLIGYDEDWHTADTREAQYQKLPGGTYRFAVRARRPNGPWGETTSFGFVVRAAFWEQLSFRLCVAAVAILFVRYLMRRRVQSLHRKNTQLEATVEARTAELKKEHAGARRILDAVEQGLFTVRPDGTVEHEISAAARRWFGVPAEGQAVWDWLGADDPNATKWLAMGWETYREGFMPKEVVLDQLPARLARAGRTYGLRWLPNETTDGALVVATDLTDTLEVERAERARHDTIESLRKLLEDRSGYMEFLEDGERLIDELCEGGLDAQQEARLLHTLKGNSAIFALNTFSALCHDLESAAEERGGGLTHEDGQVLRTRWAESTRHLLPFVNRGPDESVRVSHAELAHVIAMLERGASRRDVEQQLRQWRFEPTRPRLDRIAHQARRLAESLEKGALAVSIDDHGVRLPRGPWRPFWSSLVHVVRNAIDHGLEPEQDRLEAGKSATGLLSLETRMRDGELVVAIADDGRGIDWAKVANAARARSLPAETREDLVAALFTDGLSTADAVTATSGRGVGTAAALEAAVALGGRVAVTSEPGRGTRFEFCFPASALTDDAPPATRATRVTRLSLDGGAAA